MQTHRDDLDRLSLSELSRLTGRAPATCRERLEGLAPLATNGRTRWYSPPAALERIFGGDGLELTAERARLAAAQAERVEMENSVTKGDLGTWTELENFVATIFSACVQRLNSVPSKVAADAHAAPTIAATEDVVRRAIHEARSELADVLSGKRPWRQKQASAAPETP